MTNEEQVETVARAIADASDPYDPRDWADYLRDAAAAIAALPPSPAELAVKRVEALCDQLDREGATHLFHGPYNWNGNTTKRIRAALASPAGAPWGHDEVPELHGRSEPVSDGPGAGAPAAGPADGALPPVQGARDCTCPVGPVVPPWGHWRSCPTHEPR